MNGLTRMLEVKKETTSTRIEFPGALFVLCSLSPFMEAKSITNLIRTYLSQWCFSSSIPEPTITTTHSSVILMGLTLLMCSVSLTSNQVLNSVTGLLVFLR